MEKKRRNRAKQILTLDERLARQAQSLRMRACHTASAQERSLLFKRARQMEEARDISALLSAPASQPVRAKDLSSKGCNAS